MARRALTIVEMLIVVALILAMGALVLPFLAGRIGPVTEQASTEQAASAIAMCRLDAMREGRPLRLVARRDQDGRIELVGLPLHTASSQQEAMDSSMPPGYSGGVRNNTDGTGELPEREPMPASDPDAQRLAVSDGSAGRVYLTLPRDIRLTRRPEAIETYAQSGGSGGAFEDAASGAPMIGSEDGPIPPQAGFAPFGMDSGSGMEIDDPVTLGIFLPDGSVLVGDPVYALRDGRVFARWEINQWSGRLNSEPIDASVPDAIDDEFEDPQSLPEDLPRPDSSEFDRPQPPSDGIPRAGGGADRVGSGSRRGGL